MTSLLVVLVAALSPESEVARIQEHLAGAQALLAARDVRALTPEQLARRAVNVERLRAYREAGRFPKNRVAPGRVPVFRDEEGTLCAVGALLWASGEHALVEHVVATRNTATVYALADEPGLAAWLAREGLTLDEAARIQPSYEFLAFHFTTPSYGVPAGGCSPPVQLAPDRSDGAHTAQLTWNPSNVQVFRDARCSEPLPRQTPEAAPELRTDGAFYFSGPSPTRVTFVVRNQAGEKRQEHEILAADAQPTRGCGVAVAGPVLLGALGLVARRRRR